jgi:hypothetical protein
MQFPFVQRNLHPAGVAVHFFEEGRRRAIGAEVAPRIAQVVFYKACQWGTLMQSECGRIERHTSRYKASRIRLFK